MFVRTKSTPNSPRKSIQIVENTRDRKTGAVKQKIVRYVGIALDEVEEEKLKAMALDYIVRMEQEADQPNAQQNLFERSEEEITETIKSKKRAGRKPTKSIEDVLPLDQVNLDMIVEESRVIDGVHEVGGHIFDLLKYNQLLRNKKYNKILKDLVLCRISHPTSKLGTSNFLKRYYMKEHDLDTIYRTMDHVFEKIDHIRLATFKGTASLIPGTVDIVLFDVTTLHFESTEVDELRRFGYSKNCRFNTTQVVLALATTTDGLPIGYELFEGNKAEVRTLIETIDRWKEAFKIEHVCFIGDRAMLSEANLFELEARGYQYIVAAKLRALPEVMQEKMMKEHHYSKSEVAGDLNWVGAFEYHQDDVITLQERKARPVTVKKYQELIQHNAHRKFVVSYSTKRARHDYKQREAILIKIRKYLDNSSGSRQLVTNAGMKKYTSSQGKAQSYLDEKKIEADAMWDGFHGVITNIKDESVDLSYILNQYRRLVKIEECFRINKTTLKMRPIYHSKPERIRAHVAICYMAFSIVRQLEYRVKLLKKLSIASIIEELNSVQSSIYIHKKTKDRYRVPGNFSNEARKIYSALGLVRNLDASPLL